MQYVNRNLIDTLFKEAQTSGRKRAFHRFHAEDDNLNRLLVVGTTGAYAAPHRHAEKLEAFSHVEGGVIVVEFDDDGQLINAYDLRRVPYVELKPMTWHTIVHASDRWSVMEFALWKNKYDPTDKEFAPWAPKEGESAAVEYSEQLTKAAIELAQKNI